MDEYVLIKNQGPGSQDMSGWLLTDGDDHAYFFPTGFVLPADASVRVWTKADAGAEADTDTEFNLYWGRSDPVWGNQSDTASLRVWEDNDWKTVHSLDWP